jgi:hypothetical protein
VRALIGLAAFGVLSAAIGTVMAIGMDGAGVPASVLDGSPFHSFVAPGIILGAIVGGTQLAAAVALVRHARAALLLAAVAAFGMLIWIFVELAVMQHYAWLQAVYFGFGVVELVLVLLLLGIAPRAVTPLRAESAAPRGG